MRRFVVISLLLIGSAIGAPLTDPDQQHLRKDFQFIRKQLEKYGYLRGSPTLHEFKAALKSFQIVLNVEPTGEIDEATLSAASRPRCVHEDVYHRGAGMSRSKRFSLSKQAKWDRKHFTGASELTLKWYISSYTDDIDRNVVRSITKQAFELWSTQSNIKNQRRVTLRFVEAASQEDSDINILWAEGEHGDNYSFDGPNGVPDSSMRKENVLAHSFFPGYDFPLNGDIHLDDSENWVADVNSVSPRSNNNRFFPYVLAHEIGHTLGLHHSKKSDALMYPYYKNVPLDEIRLDVDDQCGINWNYGGSSHFCLFVWLMSEIVEFHNSGAANNNIGVVSPITTYRPGKRMFKASRIPKCSSSNDKVRSTTEERLIKNLQFTSIEAKKYTDVVCNFLAGLHMYRATPGYTPGEPSEKEYNGVMQEVNTFAGASSGSVRRMLRHAQIMRDQHRPNVFDPSYFDASFFDEFFSTYSQNDQEAEENQN